MLGQTLTSEKFLQNTLQSMEFEKQMLANRYNTPIVVSDADQVIDIGSVFLIRSLTSLSVNVLVLLSNSDVSELQVLVDQTLLYSSTRFLRKQLLFLKLEVIDVYRFVFANQRHVVELFGRKGGKVQNVQTFRLQYQFRGVLTDASHLQQAPIEHADLSRTLCQQLLASIQKKAYTLPELLSQNPLTAEMDIAGHLLQQQPIDRPFLADLKKCY